MEEYEETGFVTLRGLDFTGSVDDLYDELMAMFTEDWEDYGIPKEIVDEFNKTGNGDVLYDWLVDNAIPLYMKANKD